MKQGWSVTIEGRTDRPFDPEHVLDRLQPHHPAVQGAGDVLAATVTLDASGPLEAVELALELVRTAVKPAKMAIEEVGAMTEERQARQLERSNLPDLVGLADIAKIAGTTRQRVFQMTANRGFPAALLELEAGRLWSRPAVVAYLERTANRRRTPITSIQMVPASGSFAKGTPVRVTKDDLGQTIERIDTPRRRRG